MAAGVGSARDRPGYALRLAGFYAALFVVYGIQLPFLPLWLEARGLTAGEIALASSLPLLVRLVATPALALAADQHRAHVRMTVLLALTALAAVVLLPTADTFWTILVLLIVFLVAVQSAMPLVETIAMRGVRTFGLDYGRMRLWGSVTFLIANLAGGWLIGVVGAGIVPWLLIAGTVMTLAAALMLPSPAGQGPEAEQDGARGDAHRTGSRILALAPVRRLLGSPAVVLLLIATGAIQASHAVLYVFSAVHWASLGVPSTWIGILWAIGVAAEIALFASSGGVVRRVGAATLLVAGGLAGLVRWSLMAFDPPLAVLAPLQVLHALTFGATHLAAMHLIQRLVVDDDAGTAQSLHATVTGGIAMAGAIMAAGPLYESFKGGSYLAMAALAAVGTVAALLIRSRLATSP